MSDSTDLVTRIERLHARATKARSAGGLLGEIEDLLAEGYLEALQGEARSRRLAERLDELLDMVDQREAAVEIRRIALQKREVDARVSAVRGRLAGLREQFVQLRGLSRSG